VTGQRLLRLVLLAVLTGCSQALTPEQQLEETAREISSGIRCPVCQGLSIQDSPTPLAVDMRAVVREQLAQGKSPDEVKAFFVARYGENILMEPPAEGFNLAVYILPGLAVLAGIVVVVLLIRRWSGGGGASGNRDVAVEEDPELKPWR
jgi:cytochrome c-type biogenesis protein CcmH